MEPKRDMDERVNSEADPIDLIRAFLQMPPRDDADDADDDCDDELGELGLATE